MQESESDVSATRRGCWIACRWSVDHKSERLGRYPGSGSIAGRFSVHAQPRDDPATLLRDSIDLDRDRMAITFSGRLCSGRDAGCELEKPGTGHPLIGLTGLRSKLPVCAQNYRFCTAWRCKGTKEFKKPCDRKLRAINCFFPSETLKRYGSKDCFISRVSPVQARSPLLKKNTVIYGRKRQKRLSPFWCAAPFQSRICTEKLGQVHNGNPYQCPNPNPKLRRADSTFPVSLLLRLADAISIWDRTIPRNRLPGTPS